MIVPMAPGQSPENDAVGSRARKLGEFRGAYEAALLSGDEVAAEIAIREAIDARLTASEIDDEIIAPALWSVGERWERGEISIAEEHIATEISIRVLALKREAKRLSLARRNRMVMLATPTGEHHTVALRMVDNLLREAGYEVVMLGADVPPDALAVAVRRHTPDVVCLSSTIPAGHDPVLQSINTAHRELPSAQFVLGGRGLRTQLRAHPGIQICRRVSNVVEAVDALVQRAELN
jgi:MerR family transcriptional regulator, light-induced transcriptional regulator